MCLCAVPVILLFGSVLGASAQAVQPPPSAPRTLLVAIDTLTGSARGLTLTDDEQTCLSKLKGTVWAEYHDVRPTERMECRVPR